MGASYGKVSGAGISGTSYMIYVTVGTQLPFSRLVKAVDEWASESGADVFAQIGPDENKYESIRAEAFVSPVIADELIRSADLVVAHAGMGTIITASQYGKALIIMPRQFQLTGDRFDNITVVNDVNELRSAINQFIDEREHHNFMRSTEFAAPEFIESIKTLLE